MHTEQNKTSCQQKWRNYVAAYLSRIAILAPMKRGQMKHSGWILQVTWLVKFRVLYLSISLRWYSKKLLWYRLLLVKTASSIWTPFRLSPFVQNWQCRHPPFEPPTAGGQLSPLIDNRQNYLSVLSLFFLQHTWPLSLSFILSSHTHSLSFSLSSSTDTISHTHTLSPVRAPSHALVFTRIFIAGDAKNFRKSATNPTVRSSH